jgi:hypothetical protein
LETKAGAKHAAYGNEERVRLLGSDGVKNLFYVYSSKLSSPGDTHESTYQTGVPWAEDSHHSQGF